MNVREVYDEIKKHLETKTAHATARLGDGESMILFTSAGRQPTRLSWFLKNQFGFVMELDKVLEIKQLVLEGYSHANIIGVPTQRHKDKFGTYWAEAESKMIELAPKTKRIAKCSIDIHSELLASGLIYELIKGQKELIYISCRDLDEGFKRKFKLEKVTSYHLSPEMRYEVNKYKSEYYPKEYNEILNFINNTDCKGKLCLVGAGMLGKYYTWKLKEAGGIAIDIGNVMDKFAGLITRGKKKGAGVTTTTFKL